MLNTNAKAWSSCDNSCTQYTPTCNPLAAPDILSTLSRTVCHNTTMLLKITPPLQITLNQELQAALLKNRVLIYSYIPVAK